MNLDSKSGLSTNFTYEEEVSPEEVKVGLIPESEIDSSRSIQVKNSMFKSFPKYHPEEKMQNDGIVQHKSCTSTFSKFELKKMSSKGMEIDE